MGRYLQMGNVENVMDSVCVCCCTCEFCRIWLMAAKEVIQCPGFWWCACGSMSSLIGSGLKSHGVCVELLVTVMSSALAIVPLVTDDAVELNLFHTQNHGQEKITLTTTAINFTNCSGANAKWIKLNCHPFKKQYKRCWLAKTITKNTDTHWDF